EMAVEPAEKRGGQPRFIAAVGRLDLDLDRVGVALRKLDRALVAHVRPARRAAPLGADPGECAAAAFADIVLLLDHGAVEARAVARLDLHQLHAFAPVKSMLRLRNATHLKSRATAPWLRTPAPPRSRCARDRRRQRARSRPRSAPEPWQH